MAKDLDEIHARVMHCRNEHIVLKREINSFIKSSIKIDSVSGMTSGVWATLVEPIPVAVRSRAGTIANELRSCLDALACILAKRNGNADLSGVYFPSAKSSETFPKEMKEKLKKVSLQDQETIRRIQPYNGGHPYLFLLHEADRVRKHQNLLAFRGEGRIAPIRSGHIGLMVQTPSSGLLEVGRKVPLGVYQNVITGVSSAINLVFNEPDLLRGLDVLNTLDHFIQTTDQIISLFD